VRAIAAEIARMAGSYSSFLDPKARPTGSSGALVYGILQAFASLETGNIACLNLDRFTRSRVASHACCTCFDREGSKANQRNRSAL